MTNIFTNISDTLVIKRLTTLHNSNERIHVIITNAVFRRFTSRFLIISFAKNIQNRDHFTSMRFENTIRNESILYPPVASLAPLVLPHILREVDDFRNDEELIDPEPEIQEKDTDSVILWCEVQNMFIMNIVQKI